MEETVDDIWHVFSDGTKADIPFETDEDKVFGWNSVAICAEIAGVRVWVVTVNDTHFHSLVKGLADRAERYRILLQQRLQRHFPDENVHVACNPVVLREKVLSRFMYAYRNCMDFYKKLPGEYPIPPHWQIDEDGRILPETFVDYQAVERFFRSARAFIAFLYVRKEDEAAMKQEIYRDYLESRSIQELRRTGNKYSVNCCGKTLTQAPFEIRLKVAGRMLEEGLAGKNASFAKAVFLKPEDFRFLL